MRPSCEPSSVRRLLTKSIFAFGYKLAEKSNIAFRILKDLFTNFVYVTGACICSLLQDVISECPLSFLEWAYVDKRSYLSCRLCNAYTSTSPEDGVYLRNGSNDGYVRWATRLRVRRWDHTMSTYTWKDSGSPSVRMPRLTVGTRIVVPAKYKSGTSFEVTYLVCTVDVLIYYFYTWLLDVETYPSFILAL
jgi:hypothetical protein